MSADKYNLTKKIGEGTFGSVYSGTIAANGKRVALKVSENGQGQREMFMLKVIKKNKNKSPFVLSFYETFVMDTVSTVIVMDLLDQPLCFVIDNHEGQIPLHAIRAVSKQVLSGLKALHGMGIVHNDLKTNNVMLVDHVNHPWHVKIIDFGCAVHLKYNEGTTRYRQALAYSAPESNITTIIGTTSDMWAHACILAEMAINEVFFDAETPQEVTANHFRLMGTPSERFQKIAGEQFDEHFHYARGSLVPSYDDQEDQEERNRTQPTTFDDIETYLLAADQNKKDVEEFGSFLRAMFTWNHEDRISVESALKHTWLNTTRISDKEYGRIAKDFMLKSKAEVSRKRKIDHEDDKENKRPSP